VDSDQNPVRASACQRAPRARAFSRRAARSPSNAVNA
jgi:hypothetical protein